jgi:hypothetical protein
VSTIHSVLGSDHAREPGADGSRWLVTTEEGHSSSDRVMWKWAVESFMGGSGGEHDHHSHEDRGAKQAAERRESARQNALRALDRALMTKEAASRIQSRADRTGRNQDFKARAMSAADRNEEDDE